MYVNLALNTNFAKQFKNSFAVKTPEEIKRIAIQTIESETQAISGLIAQIDDAFPEAVCRILACRGRVVITGVGKSAIIGQKIVASLNSTGTPAIFMHAADAIHGDLGIIQQHDLVICISNSGNTAEIKVLLPMIKSLGATLVAMVGNPKSYLALQSDIVIGVRVDNEAMPGNPAPTASTTAQLVMGDALVIALLQCRGFTVKDFARYHPGGSLGKQLYLKVSDLYPRNEKPQVHPDDTLRDVILEISGKRLGVTAVIESGNIKGIITDGDLRRMLQKNESIQELSAKDIMTTTPKVTSPANMAIEAMQIMRNNNITQLLVVDDGKYLGVVHLHDILQEGII